MTNKSYQERDKIQRGSVKNDTEPRFLVIGEILKPHGVRGEIRVMPHTDLPERFLWIDTVFVGKENPQPVTLETARMHKNFVLIKLAGYDSRDAVERLRGAWLQLPEEEAIPLEDDEYFLYQLIGLAVYALTPDSEVEALLGELIRVLETGANNVFIVDGADGELLIPDIPDVILEIDFENGRMLVNLPPGLV